MLKYPSYHYDDQLRLNISLSLWIVLLYGIRHLILLVAGKFIPMDEELPMWIALQTNPALLLSDLPVLLVLLSSGHRIPDAWGVMRWCWLHGRLLLISSSLIGIALFLYVNLDAISNYNHRDFISAIFVIIFEIAIVFYLIRSERVKDVFSEFE